MWTDECMSSGMAKVARLRQAAGRPSSVVATKGEVAGTLEEVA